MSDLINNKDHMGISGTGSPSVIFSQNKIHVVYKRGLKSHAQKVPKVKKFPTEFFLKFSFPWPL